MACVLEESPTPGTEWQEEVWRKAGEMSRRYADAEIKKQTAELRAEVAVQKAVIDELARRLAIKLLPPEA